MRIDKKAGNIHLSKTDTKRWNGSGASSAAMRHDVTELMSDLVHDNLSKKGVGTVTVYDATGRYIASIWTKEKSPTPA